MGSRSGTLNSLTNSKPAQQIVSSESQLINSIAKNVGVSVVSINVTGTSSSVDFFGFGSQIQQQVAGTGIIINSDGVIITNRHVVPKGSTSVSITLSDGTTLDKVSVIGRTNEADPLDVAFLKINDKKGKTLKPATIGDSSKVQVGDRVVAIGNALGQFQNTVTDGIISGYGRSVEASQQGTGLNSESLQNLFQTDAAINPGNSGGPLVDLKGEIVGINVAIFSTSGGYQGVGFAIPVNSAKRIIARLIEGKKILYGWLGVTVQDLSDDLVKYFGLSDKNGVLVAKVLENGPAAKAGIKESDVLKQFDNKPVSNVRELLSIVGKSEVGRKIKVVAARDKKEVNLEVEIGQRPEDLEKAASEEPAPSGAWRGIEAADLGSNEAAQFKLEEKSGVAVVNVEPASASDEAGLIPGDVIIEINKQVIKNMSDYEKVIQGLKGDCLIRTQRGFFVIKGGK